MVEDEIARGREAVAVQLATQVPWCHALGSPLYCSLLERAAADCRDGVVVWTILQGQEHDPLAAAVTLRFMGAVHRLGPPVRNSGFEDSARSGTGP